MVDLETVRTMALSFDEAIEQMHFDKPSFRVKKKIFATIDLINKIVVVKLNEIDQSVFCSFNPLII